MICQDRQSKGAQASTENNKHRSKIFLFLHTMKIDRFWIYSSENIPQFYITQNFSSWSLPFDFLGFYFHITLRGVNL